jgi:hypothetical protein
MLDLTNQLQIYAGYFLANFLLLLFCLACRVWHQTKINYVFIFEYDTRHFLDWRQLSEVCTSFQKIGLLLTNNSFLLGVFSSLAFSCISISLKLAGSICTFTIQLY